MKQKDKQAQEKEILFALLQIPIAYLVFRLQLLCLKSDIFEMPKTLSGFFVLIFLLSMASTLPFFLLAENIRFIRETRFRFTFLFLIVGILFYYYGNQEYRTSFTILNFNRETYFLLSITNLAMYFLMPAMMFPFKREVCKLKEFNSQDGNEQDQTQNNLLTDKMMTMMGMMIAIAIIWGFDYTFAAPNLASGLNFGEHSLLFAFLIKSPFPAALITWIYHHAIDYPKFRFYTYLAAIHVFFAWMMFMLYHRFDFYHLLVCIISILLSSALHAAYRKFSGTNVLCLAIIAINSFLVLVVF